jgi:hypothetical protein
VTFSFTVAESTTGTVAVVAYRDGNARTFKVSVDGGSESTVSMPTATPAAFVTGYTTPTLSPGTHSVAVRYWSGSNFVLDFAELNATDPPTTTTTTSTTSVPPSYDGPDAAEFSEAHQDLLAAGAFVVFFLAVLTVAAWRRGG